MQIRLSIEDWNFLEYPQISLIERPSFLPSLMPHVDVLGYLCYFSPGTVTLDRFDPATALAQCLDQATVMLDRIAADPDYRIDDIQNEFPAHWEYGQLSLPWKVFLGDIYSGETSAGYFIMRREGIRHALVTSDADEAHRLARALGATLTASRYRCWLLETAIRPSVSEQTPKTVKEVFAWVRTWDPALAAGVQKVLCEKDYLKQTYATFAIKSPVGWIGFGFDLNQLKRLGYAKSPKRYRNFLHQAGGGSARVSHGAA